MNRKGHVLFKSFHCIEFEDKQETTKLSKFVCFFILSASYLRGK